MINKRLTAFEFTIISFFIAIILSVLIVFVTNQVEMTHLSFPLNYITLSFLIDKLEFDNSFQMEIRFIFYILIFTLYGLLFGIMNKYSNKIKYIYLLLIVLITFLIFQEKTIIDFSDYSVNSATVIKSTKNIKENKYFGFEARGDLNADGKEDVAFIVKRNDEIRGDLYYLSASLKVNDGYEGLNLLFLGEKEIPNQITIEDGVIGVELNKSIFYAHLIDTNIKELIY